MDTLTETLERIPFVETIAIIEKYRDNVLGDNIYSKTQRAVLNSIIEDLEEKRPKKKTNPDRERVARKYLKRVAKNCRNGVIHPIVERELLETLINLLNNS